MSRRTGRGTTDNGAWNSASYVWNADDTDASLAWFFGEANVGGTAHDVPGATSCTFCHGDAEPPLGFTALQLASDDDDDNDSLDNDNVGLDNDNVGLDNDNDNVGLDNDNVGLDNDNVDLDDLVAAGWLSHAPQRTLTVPGDNIDRRALGVLHVNCGSCHADTGSQNDLPLRFRLRTDELARVDDTGAVFTAVGQRAQDELGGLRTYLQPGASDESLVLLRMSSRGSDLQMPPVGTEDVDVDGVASVRAWIERRR